ncbi:MAG: SDR family oxidoreductase [Devosiaceae bacterium]|nr:SDR family oxidoreductase [Devosiaceae bacterium MH13]
MSAEPTHPVAGRTAFITGASRGIGAAAAYELAGRGAKVVLAARTTADCEAHAAAIREAGGQALAVSCDVGDHESVKAALAAARDAFGPITILVNNAGILDPIGRIDDVAADDWAKVIEINVLGVYYCARETLSDMRNAQGGTIINLSSGAANSALEGWSHYCTSKAAVKMFTMALHKELASEGIRAIGLSPGTVATKMQVDIKASGINPVSQLDPAVHIPAEWAGKAIAWMCTPHADAHLGTDISLRLPEIRAAVGVPTEWP